MLVPILRGLRGNILTLRGRKGNNSDFDSKGSRLYYLDSDYEGWRGYDSDAAALLACGRLSPTIDKQPVCCTWLPGRRRQEEGFRFTAGVCTTYYQFSSLPALSVWCHLYLSASAVSYYCHQTTLDDRKIIGEGHSLPTDLAKNCTFG